MHDIAKTRATDRPHAADRNCRRMTLGSVPMPDIAVNEAGVLSPPVAIARRGGASDVLIIFRDGV